jgi:outer membrane lipoprotein-sorting protein
MKYLKLAILMLAIASSVSAAKFKNGEELVSAMHKKYAKKWYKTLTFVQKNTQFAPDGTPNPKTTIWYEAISAPGKLRIDYDPLEKGDGMLAADGMQYIFKDGKLTKSQPFIHPLMVLGFDVYLQPIEKTVSQLKELKFDLSVLREDTWQGRPVYVVGAKEGDLRSLQFWVDRENLYFVRSLETVGKNKDRVQEIQFNKYKKVKTGGWIAPEVVFLIDGKRFFMEEYTDIKTNIRLADNLFDSGEWLKADRNYFK